MKTLSDTLDSKCSSPAKNGSASAIWYPAQTNSFPDSPDHNTLVMEPEQGSLTTRLLQESHSLPNN